MCAFVTLDERLLIYLLLRNGMSLNDSSSSSSSSESDLGGAITLLQQDHRTTNKLVCKQPEHSKQFML